MRELLFLLVLVVLTSLFKIMKTYIPGIDIEVLTLAVITTLAIFKGVLK